MAATIKIKNSSTAGAAPTASDLVQGELAVNVTDKRLYTENSGGTIVELGTNPSVPVTFPDGSASAPSLTNSGDTNTGMFFPAADTIALTTGGSERLRLDSSGNLGLGVTPSAWASGTYKAFQVSGGGAISGSTGQVNFSQNWVGESGADKYISNGFASSYAQALGAHKWFNAPSGTAGNTISFTQAMTLDASGNLLVGRTSPLKLWSGDEKVVSIKSTGSDACGVNISSSNANNITLEMFASFGNTNTGFIAKGDAVYPEILFSQLNGSTYAERARIDSSGNLLLATTTVTSVGWLQTTSSNAKYAWVDRASVSNSGNPAGFFNSAGTNVGGIATSNTATTYSTGSDYRLKEVSGSLVGYKERLSALQPKQGTWKADGSEFRGFLAHEFAESYPTSVTGAKDAVDVDGNPQYQGMQAGSAEVIADLVAMIQEQQAIITQLQADVAALKGQA